MPYSFSGNATQAADITILDTDGNLLKRQNVSQGNYTIDGIMVASGIVFAIVEDQPLKGYGLVNFEPYGLVATGGTITTTVSGGNTYAIHTFTSSATFEVSANTDNRTIDYLIIGGGGGGANTGAGGGAGGYIYATNSGISPGSYSITVGTGGLGGQGTADGGDKGGNSVFNNITAEGGGGGWSHGSTSAQSGGCGAGGAIKTSGSPTIGGVGTQGYNGGDGFVQASWQGGSGGGGGAGQAGSAGSNSSGSGKGGNGLSNDITGVATYYAGGGAGGEVHGSYVSAGGLGGGGAAVMNGAGNNGTNGLGGGGAGGAFSGSYHDGGNGGSGVVIIRYRII